MEYDVLIVGGGAAGMSCGLVLGSAKPKAYASDKKIGLIAHQKTSHLQNALFNNVLGLKPGTLGKDILIEGIEQIKRLYPHVDIIEKEKVKSITDLGEGYVVETNKNRYHTKISVLAVGYTDLMTIKGLEDFIESHPRAAKEKNRVWLRNVDHLIKKNLFVAGTLAGWRSQYAISCGSGAHVATDILTLWNNGKHTKVHDKVTL